MAQRPEPSFLLIVQLHQLQAMLKLGAIPNPATGTPDEVDIPAAQHELALLHVLREKTAGNLTGEEEQLLDQVIDSIHSVIENFS